VRLKKNCEVPADLLLIHSSNISGLVFVDTMNLDGETNLKEKMVIVENFEEKTVPKLMGDITCDTPNELLDAWEGNINCHALSEKTI